MSAKKKVGMLAIGVILSAMFAVSSHATTITFSHAAGYPGGAGEFNAVLSNGHPLFQTFCLERNEFITMGTPYDFNISMAAVNGGFGGGSPDHISSQTAYLFTNFFHGTLGDYSHSGADQKALQYAFWYLEEEVSYADAFGFGAKKWIDLANANANGTYYDVTVINPYEGRTQKQSVLFVPEAGAMILFGSGLMGLIGYRRTRRMA